MDELSANPKLHVIPYVPGIAEYAAKVRTEIVNRKDTDFIIAVDLPHGLEKQVMTAVKMLPRASVLVDQLYRGIPIIPSSAPVEAVRSYQESGADLQFIDTSLPVTGNSDEYRFFIEQCRLFGVGNVIKNAEQYGISPKDILKSWLDTLEGAQNKPAFCNIPELTAAQIRYPEFSQNISPYFQTRLKYMAGKLQEHLSTGSDVLLVSSVSHVNGIMHFLKEPQETFDDSYIVPSQICAVGENDLLNVTSEVPYFMYLYDIYRDTPVEREKWIATAYCGTDRKTISPDAMRAVTRYAFNLALTDEELFPDIYNLVASAKYCVDDDFAYRVFRLLKSYPPSEKISSECRFSNILDYNFLPLTNQRSLTIKVSKSDNPDNKGIRRRLRRTPSSQGYYRFSRSDRSLSDERDFMKYMTSRFTAFHLSQDDYCIHEFISGFEEGIDIRETIRHKLLNKIYVKGHATENQVCYVLDYRSASFTRPLKDKQEDKKIGPIQVFLEENNRFCSQKIFFDKNYPWVGLATNENNHYKTGIMVGFSELKKDPVPIMDELNYSHPLVSAVKLGIRHAKQVFVFTDNPEEIQELIPFQKQVKLLPSRSIPDAIFEKMHEFDIECWRTDDRRGD